MDARKPGRSKRWLIVKGQSILEGFFVMGIDVLRPLHCPLHVLHSSICTPVLVLQRSDLRPGLAKERASEAQLP